MEELETENTTKWTRKQLHGQYKRQVAYMRSHQWRTPTYYKAKILNMTNDPKCRMCKEKDETVAHIVSACSKIAGSWYKTRHNNVAAAVHHSKCQHYEIKTTDNIWLHKPNAVTENNKVKVLWDFEIKTDRQIQARRPELVVIDKQTKEGLIIDVAIPNDTHTVETEREKIEQYQDLRLEIQRMWNIKARVVPIVIGALGATSNNLEKHLQEIPGKKKIPQLVKIAILGSAHILRNVLDLSESR